MREALAARAHSRCLALPVVEDEWNTAVEIANAFKSKGAAIVGPVPTVREALNALESEGSLDGAVLDLNLRGEMAFAVADALSARGIPFVIATGYGEATLKSHHREIPRCDKPFEPLHVVRAWSRLQAQSRPTREQVMGNRLLASLDEQIFNALLPSLQVVELAKRSVLDLDHGDRSAYSYFLTAGVASCVLTNPARECVEVGVVGSEGVVGLRPRSRRASGRKQSSMLIAGFAVRIETNTLVDMAEAEPCIRRPLQRFSETFLEQVAGNLLGSTRYTVEQRLARWLLLVSDRCDGPSIPITHENIAVALGVRRAGITVGLNHLSKIGCIDNSRGELEIIDRAALAAASAGCYP
jgi:CRP-like cAMP-binding protein